MQFESQRQHRHYPPQSSILRQPVPAHPAGVARHAVQPDHGRHLSGDSGGEVMLNPGTRQLRNNAVPLLLKGEIATVG